MNKMSNDYISSENQDVIYEINSVLPKLERLQGEYEVDAEKKKQEDEPWKKRFDKASGEFYHRSKAMLDIKPFFDEDNTKNHAMLGGGIWLLLCIMAPPPPDQFFTMLFGNVLLALFIWFILIWVIIKPINKVLNIKIKRRIEQNKIELEEIKKREYPILFEKKPSYVYMDVQLKNTQQAFKPLKEQHPKLEFLLYGAHGFSDTIEGLQYVRNLLENGIAQTLDYATDMLFERNAAKRKIREAEINRNYEAARVYQEEQRRKEEAAYQRSREEYARREAEETAWLKEQEQKRQQAFENEIRTGIENSARHAREWGKDRQTVKMYDDQLGRSYHERLDEDRKYEYGEKDKASDIGGDI
ncbi:hypothetical protein bcgnr5378_29080 [Bacillus cereus]